MTEPGFDTLAVHAGQPPDPATGAVVVPIHLATTFAQAEVGVHRGYEYGRSSNPTRTALEACLAALEGAAYARAFGSGLAAEDALLRLLDPGDHVIVGDNVYGGTHRLLARVHRGVDLSPVGLDVGVSDAGVSDAGVSDAGVSDAGVSDAGAEALEAAFRSETRIVWVETPSNPYLRIADLPRLAEVAHRHGALLVVDNTFATPYLQRPLSLGADVVVHSATKYLGGHSDVIGGVVVTNDQEVAARVAFVQNAAGAVPSPFDCYLLLRGIKTLGVRMDRHCANALRVAEMLAAHPAVERVNYPGLASDPGHALASAQMRGFGGMVSFSVRGGEEAAVKVAASTELFTLAESLGAVESLIEHPHRMTHASVAGTPLAVDPALLRLSVGIEHAGDLIADLEHALAMAGRAGLDW